ncbi:type II secretion system protein [Halopseudomonas sabulinigri]
MLIGSTPRRNQQGVTFLWVMLLLVFLTLGLGRYLELLSTREQRSLEADLLWKGEQYRAAIQAFAEASPGEEKQLPHSLDDLLVDPRLLTYTRHLRRAYLDPITEKPFEEIYDSQGRLIGVRSASLQAPIKTAGFPPQLAHFEDKKVYNQWEFIYLP